jgi:uncharacterized protein (TIGR00369 family)
VTGVGYYPVMTAGQLTAFLEDAFPQMYADGRPYEIATVSPGETVLHFNPSERHLRPGNTVSGPSLFALADYASYAAVLAHIGPVPLAVTTSLNMTFMRRPPLGTLTGTASLMKLGRSLVVIDVKIAGLADPDVIAHAVATFSVPPRSAQQ